VEWETSGVAGTRRFLDRTWRLLVDPETDTLTPKVSTDGGLDNRELERALHGATHLGQKVARLEVQNLLHRGRIGGRVEARHAAVGRRFRAQLLPRRGGGERRAAAAQRPFESRSSSNSASRPLLTQSIDLWVLRCTAWPLHEVSRGAV
jgi:hypothetical protein